MNLRRLRTLVVTMCLPLTAMFSLSASAQDHYLLVLSSLGGESYYTKLFNRWGSTMMEVATEQLGLEPSSAVWLGEAGDNKPERMTATSRREAILEQLDTLATTSKPGDSILIVMIGHGSVNGRRALFNIPGPDLSATDLNDALQPLNDRHVAIVNTTPASAQFINVLSRTGRIIITATANNRENHHTRFAGEFVAAWATDTADRNKDKRVSLLEAFNYSKQQTERFYESENRLLTEHAQLDDNGDGEGSREPTATVTEDNDTTTDGAIAHRFFFDPISLAVTSDDQDPEITRTRLKLKIDARELVDRIERLKRRKIVLPDEEFSVQLEDLLIELALNRREWRELGQ